MSFHLSHIHDYERFLAVDIGSYKTRTGVYSIESLDPVLMGFSSVRQSRKNIIAGTVADMRGVALSIERSMIQASQKVDSIPKDVIIAFSSSQFISDYTTTQYIRNTNSVITMNEIDEMVKKIEKSSFDRIRTKAKNVYGILYDDLKLVSSTITAIEIDGKTITNPVGFGGTRVRLSILNLFSPASEFNVIRSIASHIGKNIISLIPVPLIFPKILEKTDNINNSVCIVDVGLLHTTIICIEKNSIIALETFPIGSQSLIELIGMHHGDLTLLQIEHMLAHDEYRDTRLPYVKEFLEYILDMVNAFVESNAPQFSIDSFFCHGGILASEDIFGVLSTLLRDKYSKRIGIRRFSELLNCNNDQVVTDGLALIATELLMVKKDPLVRILRYVLYNYE